MINKTFEYFFRQAKPRTHFKIKKKNKDLSSEEYRFQKPKNKN